MVCSGEGRSVRIHSDVPIITQESMHHTLSETTPKWQQFRIGFMSYIFFNKISLLIIIINVFLEAVFLCVILTILELSLQARLTWNSQKSTCLRLPSARIRGVCHNHQALLFQLVAHYYPVFYSKDVTEFLNRVGFCF